MEHLVHLEVQGQVVQQVPQEVQGAQAQLEHQGPLELEGHLVLQVLAVHLVHLQHLELVEPLVLQEQQEQAVHQVLMEAMVRQVPQLQVELQVPLVPQGLVLHQALQVQLVLLDLLELLVVVEAQEQVEALGLVD